MFNWGLASPSLLFDPQDTQTHPPLPMAVPPTLFTVDIIIPVVHQLLVALKRINVCKCMTQH